VFTLTPHRESFEYQEAQKLLSEDSALFNVLWVSLFLGETDHVQGKVLHEVHFMEREDLVLKYLEKKLHELVVAL